MPVAAPQEPLSITTLISHASLPVQLIMLILIIMSILSWAVIISKTITLRRNAAEIRQFEDDFWHSKDLGALYREVSGSQDAAGPAGRVFSAGMGEYLKGQRQSGGTGGIINPAELPDRAMKASFQREIDSMERRMNVLASTGSVSPYIGLLGTVWGIMQSFIGLSANAQATLAAVAPGIAEALIATAIGLFAAIPAVLGYNYLSNQIDIQANRLESFMDEFLNILQRQGR